ncbi:DUF402 domain-containing protein [Glutamicibacter mysorens]|uniref:DUF402 domain-containing protein n=1 Tax=Glutamicibacter mysorens TaxID=257984 RepID=UPI0020C6D012|nr:DUF402 domain-containing protein [Glutamicibacter mysorens]UTM46918.1 YgaC family protein [Glutamicibacter mysorens]
MSPVRGCPADLPRSPENIGFGALVVARAWKFDGSPHWVVPGFYLGQDEFGHWLHQPAGSLVARPGTAHLAATSALCLIPHRGDWIATMYSDAAEDFDVYIDLSSNVGWLQMKRDAWEVNSIDLDLDVIRSRSKGTFLDDEDEFADHALSMGYPQKLQDSVRDTSEKLLESVAKNSPPFNHAHRESWLAKVADLATA